ncbi:hypothetical protein HFO71_10395 [Rhizobium laguerreae]|uniref:hypothetical protein n=1 Tax=Rhizobium laguerreae TaxID=1076926 RepID=UPI001C91D1D3|nr:hypothetical protein [Rhizobium laguerreae]MBY3070750.1 hypothetical protein [Rhizobium laguerreae]
MTPAELEYDDNLSVVGGHEILWRTVLLNSVQEAFGIGFVNESAKNRVMMIRDARDYIMRPAKGFIDVCNLAGFDPDAVRERLIPRIKAAPSPEELAVVKWPKRKPGVVADFPSVLGTGGGSNAFERDHLSFHKQGLM